MEGQAAAALVKVRQGLADRGARTIAGVQRVFRLMDSLDGNKRIERHEFETGLREAGIDLSREELSALFIVFDKNGDGIINFDEFLVTVRGTPNAARQELIDRAFAKFDRDGSGSITIADFRGVYNATHHPKFKTGEYTEDQVFQEFLTSFNDKDHNGSISKEEWNEYYAGVSSSIDNDEHFIQLLTTAWQLN